MHYYYSSADEPFLGPLVPLPIFCAPHFNFMELKWGPKRKVGAPKNFFPALRAGNGPPLSICFLHPWAICCVGVSGSQLACNLQEWGRNSSSLSHGMGNAVADAVWRWDSPSVCSSVCLFVLFVCYCVTSTTPFEFELRTSTALLLPSISLANSVTSLQFTRLQARELKRWRSHSMVTPCLKVNCEVVVFCGV